MSKTRQKESQNTLTFYLKDISHIPLLTRKEEKDLGRRIQNGDELALQTLVESNLRFVIKFAARYRQCGLSLSDLINEGNIGLIMAAKRFDPDRNVRFISYAVWWIRQSIMSALASMTRPFKLPARFNTALYRIRAVSSDYRSKWDRRPTLQEIAKDTGIKEEEVQSAMRVAGGAISLNQPMLTEGEKGLKDILVQTCIPSAERGVVERSVKKSLNCTLRSLKERERQILKLRYGLHDDVALTLKQIGNKLGVSRERVRQIQEEALKKIRQNKKAGPLQKEVMLLAKILELQETSPQ